MLQRSLILMRNNKRPRMEPWGTPDITGSRRKETPLFVVVGHVVGDPVNKLDWNLEAKMSVQAREPGVGCCHAKAFLRSKSTQATHYLSFSKML